MVAAERLSFAAAAELRDMQLVRILNDINMKRMRSVITIPMKYGVEFGELVMIIFSAGNKQTNTMSGTTLST